MVIIADSDLGSSGRPWRSAPSRRSKNQESQDGNMEF